MKTMKEKEKINAWVNKLSSESLPLFAHTARSIASLSTDCETSITQMSQSILSDSAMTARVLRMANSVHYNPSTQPINTVSRAIVVLGFNCVRNIALSITLIDTILSGIRHDRAIEEMVRAYHAAVQARNLAKQMHSNAEEEIFVATLLQRIGQLIFWCFPYGQAESLDFEYSMRKSSQEAEECILGFSLKELTEELVDQWHLSELMKEPIVLPEESEIDGRVLVQLGYQISTASEQGWASEETLSALKLVSRTLGIGLNDVREAAYINAQEALDNLLMLGIPNPAKIIPKTPCRHHEQENQQKVKVDNQIDLQLSMLKEVSSMVFQEVDINLTLHSVLEGVHRSLTMDRTVFALACQETNSLKAKFVMGGHKEILMERFYFSLNPKYENLITHIYNSGKATFIDHKYRYKLPDMITPEFKRCIGDNEAFVMPIFIGGVTKGLVYADRCITKRPFSMSDFQVFEHFCEHINIAFKILSK